MDIKVTIPDDTQEIIMDTFCVIGNGESRLATHSYISGRRLRAMIVKPCSHDKVYSNTVLCSFPPQYPWICRKCGKEGTDRGAWYDNGAEYDILTMEKAHEKGINL